MSGNSGVIDHCNVGKLTIIITFQSDSTFAELAKLGRLAFGAELVKIVNNTYYFTATLIRLNITPVTRKQYYTFFYLTSITADFTANDYRILQSIRQI